MKPYFQEGAQDMGIFEGMGAGWYFKYGSCEYGPYLTEEEARSVQREVNYGGPDD